ncbi:MULTISPECIES: MFS transporter [Amycolatopsis]|uniref:MFS transporter n=1 Tax=Amycolatopsis bullii TaxID=941987 RepID=A0ABQ3KNJ4_9PSEU|nr:MFS transporter [Amycolatopsis bullii]GHG34761.1 MFS transporter [Amycolatopsis bullii]
MRGKTGWRGTAPLHVPAYRRLWTVAALSHFGTWMHNTAAAAQLANFSAVPAVNALLPAAATLPVFLLALPAGMLADRIGRGTVLFWANAASALTAALFAALDFAGALGPGALLALTFALNAAWAAAYPAWNAEVSSTLPGELIKDGAALNSLSFNIARTLGPAAGGWLFGAVGGLPVYAVNALSFAGFVLCFRDSRRIGQLDDGPDGWRAGWQETTTLLRESVPYRALLTRTWLFFLLAQVMFALTPVYLLTVRRLPEPVVGLALAAFGVGAVCSAVAYPAVRHVVTDRVLRAGCASAAALGLAVLPLAEHVGLLLVVATVFGAAFAGTITMNNAFLQLSVALRLRSRAVALYTVVLYGAQTLGALAAGALANLWGVGPAAWVAAALLVVSALAGLPAGSEPRDRSGDQR